MLTRMQMGMGIMGTGTGMVTHTHLKPRVDMISNDHGRQGMAMAIAIDMAQVYRSICKRNGHTHPLEHDACLEFGEPEGHHMEMDNGYCMIMGMGTDLLRFVYAPAEEA
eukprot:TRINITY_DN6601_c0_g1::TRINITY_DN6601_c0_g1_i1::g.13456::m.13456 TRINITY_DN6601_c0_g1::TRINITY_DN6601_c0_g1_i1::g.13456  ORF type:complete len:109 (-),score=13.00 TRINITY_DN6601_c0_g1_i1:167-493(-)